MDERELIIAAKKNDLDAFNQLVLKYQQLAYNVALRTISDKYAADDATQKAFISAYQKINTFRGGSFKAWLLRIVVNKCYDMLRKQKRHPTSSIDNISNDPDEDFEEAYWLEDENPTPEEQVSIKELESAVQGCIEDLPVEFRSVVVLVDVQGMNYKEAAEIIKTPLGTIKSRLARARSSLQDCLSKFKELLPQKYRSISEGSHE